MLSRQRMIGNWGFEVLLAAGFRLPQFDLD
jgi:hypothetical protein